MAKVKTKPTPIPATDAAVDRVSKTEVIKCLVKLANVFVRIGARGPIEVDVPLLCAVQVPDKGDETKLVYRRHNINAGAKLQPERISIGKRDGMIFRFEPSEAIERQGIPITAIEMQWDDICNNIPEAIERLDSHFDNPLEEIRNLDANIRKMVEANPGMHKILMQGFEKAQSNAATEFKQEQVEGHELYGQWG